MNSYEVTLIEKREKTLLVSAESETEAMLRVQNGFVRGEIDMNDTPDRLVKILVDDARAGLFAIKPDSDNELVDISEVTEDDEWDEFCDLLDDEYGHMSCSSCYNPCNTCGMRDTCAAFED